MTRNLTLVTGLFNLGRGEMEGGMKRSFDHYLECFKRMLRLDFPMVVYIEPQYESVVWEIRGRENTRVILKTLDDLRAFPFNEKIQSIRTNPSWYNQAGWLVDSTQAKLELYNPLVMNKQFMLNDASLFNYFDTKYFLWVDGGLSNTVNLEQYFTPALEKQIIPHLNKMMFLAFPYDGQVEVHGFTKSAMNSYAGTDTKYVCRGGVFGGNKDAINSFNDQYYHLLNDTLNAGHMGTEESVFTLATYRDPKKYNIRYIEGNGLVYKFFEDLQQNKIEAEPEFPLAFYAITYNLPRQFKMWAESFRVAYPEEFEKNKKYVVNNSTDPNLAQEYSDLFKEYGFEVIHEGDNLGINDGRVFCSKHFDKSNHKYMIFFEDDMLLVCDGENDADWGESPTGKILKGQPCKNGFVRYIPNLFQKSIDILEDNDLDFLRLSHTEVFGDCHFNWGYKNVAHHRRDEIFPDDKGSDELRWKTRVDYTGSYKGLAYAVGNYHYSNWPLLFNKRGNRQLFLSDEFEHWYEQTLSSLSCQYTFDKKMKVGSLLAAPINHFRKFHYDGSTRRENRHYKN
jgi:hypothetical protein